MEPNFVRELRAEGYLSQRDDADLLSSDGREVYEVKVGGRGVRDLRDATLRLATFLARHPNVDQGYVLASLIRIGAGRVRAEWDLIKQVVLPEIGTRMYLVAIIDGTEVAEPSRVGATPVIDRFREFVKTTSNARNSGPFFSDEHGVRAGSALGVSWKHLEVEKVLVHRWLLNEAPIAVGALSRQVGCSYPTAMQALRRLTADELIERGRGRSVGLLRYPRDRWADLLRAQRLVYPPKEFVDPTTAPGAVDEIMRRLNRLRPKGIAVGGVIAARQWDPSFDLNGTPRIDLVLHTPIANAPYGQGWVRDATELVRRLDPALKRRSPHAQGATVLVVHQTHRQDPLFFDEPPSLIPRADPVEVLYHLHDLGLTAQAGELLRRMRERVKS